MVGLPKAIIKKYGVTKKAWQVFRGRHGKAHVTSHKTKTRSVRSTVRRSWRRKGHRGKSLNMLNIGVKVAKVGALLAPAIHEGLIYDKPFDKLAGGLGSVAGWNHGAGKWQWEMLAQAWTPFVAVTLGATAVKKISGFLRRL